jgi:hypothetical protein
MKLQSCSFLQLRVTSSLSSMCSNTVSQCSLKVGDECSYPYKKRERL